MSIRRLPPHLVNRIAAGEVVERPASALKELVENSIDAGATRIAIVLVQGGIGRIEVADDGCGMSADDMALALERHCTSKLPDEAIEAVLTLGFRGEALPSIASVARVTIESRPAGSDGWSRVVDNGEVLRDGPAAVPPGTRIVVEDLFARVPARRKFLRSPRSEYAACLDMVRRLAMARPDIAFTLEHDGRRVLTVPGGEERPGRVAGLTDRALAENSVAIDWVRDMVSLGGVAGLPAFNPHATSAYALALTAAGRPAEAIEHAATVIDYETGTYADTTVALETRGLALAQQGDAAGSAQAFQDAHTIIDATDDVLMQALLKLAEASALHVLGDDRGITVAAAADDALDALGLGDTAWRVAFSIAASGAATANSRS